MSIPSLAYLLDINNPRITRNSKTGKSFVFEGDHEDTERLNSAITNAHEVLDTGIEAVTDLLMNIEMHCSDEVKLGTKIAALSLIIELTQALRAIRDQEFMLNNPAKANQQA